MSVFDNAINLKLVSQETSLKFGDLIYQDSDKTARCLLFEVSPRGGIYSGIPVFDDPKRKAMGNLGSHLSTIEVSEEQRAEWDPLLWPYRRLVNVGGGIWKPGIQFLSEADLQDLRNGEGLFGESLKQAAEILIEKSCQYHVLLHFGAGHMNWVVRSVDSLKEAEQLAEKTIQDSEISPLIADRTYSGDPKYLNKVEIRLGTQLLKEFHLLRGQGEDYFEGRHVNFGP